MGTAMKACFGQTAFLYVLVSHANASLTTSCGRLVYSRATSWATNFSRSLLTSTAVPSPLEQLSRPGGEIVRVEQLLVARSESAREGGAAGHPHVVDGASLFTSVEHAHDGARARVL